MAALETTKIRHLAEQARSGNRAAFSELMRMLMTPVVALTYRMTGNRDSAKDLAQETFIAAWEHLREFRGDARFESWLYRIAINKTLHLLESRKNQPHEELDDHLAAPETAPAPDEAMEQRELRQNILSFMQMLPEQQRVVFELRFYQQLTFGEIASVTGKAEGTAKTLYREAIKKLRAHALEQGWRS